MPIERSASSTWKGSLKQGRGEVSVQSGAFRDLAVTYRTRFENNGGTNPEELVAAAHAACFSMALSAQLGEEGFEPSLIETTATVTLVRTDTGYAVTSAHLETEGEVENATDEQFMRAAENAKNGCPISKLLAPGLESLTLDAKLRKPAGRL
ncbi:MAG: OsmC family protein [Candidatus Hydrogenedentes bacterium]|nr:OsmC family protein [Candidatus Hydrogenedentota bacterium]